MSKFYTGVGSRETPIPMLAKMVELSRHLARKGYILRSGGAGGADSAFAMSVSNKVKHIYTPWRGFNNIHNGRLAFPIRAAYEMAQVHHPAWGNLKPGAKALHARNCHQVLGDDLQTPSEFVVCWTPDGCESQGTRSKGTGGTATAIVLAEAHGVQVFNLANVGRLEMLYAHLGEPRWPGPPDDDGDDL